MFVINWIISYDQACFGGYMVLLWRLGVLAYWLLKKFFCKELKNLKRVGG